MTDNDGWRENQKFVLEAIKHLEKKIEVAAYELAQDSKAAHDRLRHDMEQGFQVSSNEHSSLGSRVNQIQIAIAEILAVRAVEKTLDEKFKQQLQNRSAVISTVVSAAMNGIAAALKTWSGH